MPVDSDGNRADIVMDGGATIARMNIGRLYEQYINAASRDVKKGICKMLGVERSDKHYIAKLTNLFDNDKERFNQIYTYLMGFYKIVSPRMFDEFSVLPSEKKLEHMFSLNREALELYIPTDNSPELIDMIKDQIELHYPPVYGPVTYKGNSGRYVTTRSNFRIGSVYMMLLEKIGDVWSSLSSGKLQHFGILSQLTRTDKHAQPTRNQPVKAIGETEGRIIVSYGGPKVIAELMDRNNNPETHKRMVWAILSADQPSNIDLLNDRKVYPFGGSKPIQLITHIAMCAGWKYKYTSKKKFPTFTANSLI